MVAVNLNCCQFHEYFEGKAKSGRWGQSVWQYSETFVDLVDLEWELDWSLVCTLKFKVYEVLDADSILDISSCLFGNNFGGNYVFMEV